MIKLTAKQFVEAYGKLPNPDRMGLEKQFSSPYFDVAVLPRVGCCREVFFDQKCAQNVNVTLNLQVIRFQLDANAMGPVWKLLTPVEIDE